MSEQGWIDALFWLTFFFHSKITKPGLILYMSWNCLFIRGYVYPVVLQIY